jgi:SAM-dependent methyltransferase
LIHAVIRAVMRITFGKTAALASLTSFARAGVVGSGMEYDPRDLEWQRRYEANDTPWDKGEASPVLVDFLRERGAQGRVLVPGCGRGHDAWAVAGQAGAAVVGLDLSDAAVAQARELTPDDAANVSFITGDFFRLPEAMAGSFDWIVEHTCFCAIDPKQRPGYVTAAAGALRPGGKMFAIFYLDPRSETAPPFPVSREELSRLFDPRFELLEEWVPTRSFAGREGRELARILRRR